jgi:hypothetical protein
MKGGVLMGSYPGYATVTEGRIEGDTVFLSANGGRKAPNLRFQITGTIRDGVLKLTVLDNKGILGKTGIRLEGRKVPESR